MPMFCMHALIHVCMQSVYRSSEDMVQCSVHVLAKLEGCQQRVVVMHDGQRLI